MKIASTLHRLFFAAMCLGLALALPAGVACSQPWGGDRGPGGGDWRGRGGDDQGPPRRGPDDGGDRRRGPEGEDRRGRGDDSERRGSSDQERREWFLRRLDRNGDGKIERSEVDSDRMWGFFERSAKEAGLDPSRTVNVSDYLKARQVQDRQRLRAENPTAFLAPGETKTTPGFDTPLSESELLLLNPDKEQPFIMVSAPAGSSPTGSSSAGRSGDESREDRTQRYARSLMERYDKNGNHILEQDEWKDMRGDPERSDLNHDGKITQDELEKRFGSFGRDDSNSSSSGSDRGTDRRERSSSDDRRDRSRSSRDDDNSDNTRTTYRFTSALERLPRDARSWVERYDKNKDGQVEMAEYSSSWSDSKVREFAKYDLDGDGIVTGIEYLKSKDR